MKTFIFIICMFIGILAFKLYLPEECRSEDERIYMKIGFLVGAFWMTTSYIALASLHNYFERKKEE